MWPRAVVILESATCSINESDNMRLGRVWNDDDDDGPSNLLAMGEDVVGRSKEVEARSSSVAEVVDFILPCDCRAAAWSRGEKHNHYEKVQHISMRCN